MDYSILIQVVVVGVANGLIALGFVLIYKATSILNRAMGEFMTLGAFLCSTSLTIIHVPFYIAFPITILFAVILGIVMGLSVRGVFALSWSFGAANAG